MVNLSQTSHRKLVTALSYHVMYGEFSANTLVRISTGICLSPVDITECTTLTPTGMVAFLLLHKYREVCSHCVLTRLSLLVALCSEGLL